MLSLPHAAVVTVTKLTHTSSSVGWGMLLSVVKDGGADVLNGAQHGQALTTFQRDRPFSAIAEHRALQ